jgi:hypothetical protein
MSRWTSARRVNTPRIPLQVATDSAINSICLLNPRATPDTLRYELPSCHPPIQTMQVVGLMGNERTREPRIGRLDSGDPVLVCWLTGYVPPLPQQTDNLGPFKRGKLERIK